MTTQTMYDNGIRCKGSGFNCPTCHERGSCVEYITPISKYPLGITPKDIWLKQRLLNIKGAMQRYSEASLLIPTEWIDEYNELVKIIKED